MDTIYTAIGAVFVAWLAHFLAEDYKAFREGSSIAAMLAGELTSYHIAFIFGNDALEELIDLVNKGKIDRLPTIATPTDHAFNASTPRLGLLGPIICRDVFYVYHNIAAFRSSFGAACTQNHELGAALTASLLKSGTAALERAAERYAPLIEKLDARARARWGIWKALNVLDPVVASCKLWIGRKRVLKRLRTKE